VSRSREINWRREAIYPAQALAEACLIAPWLLLFLSLSVNVQPESITLECLAVILGTLYLARVMDGLRIDTWVQRAVILVGIISLSLLALHELVFSQPPWIDQDWLDLLLYSPARIDLIPGALLIFLSVLWLCWRGLRLVNKPVSVIDVAMGFQIGVVVLALFALVSSARAVTIFVPAFFFSELLAVGLTRVEAVSQTSTGRRLTRGASGWWLAVLVGATGTLMILAGLIAAIILGAGRDTLLNWLGPVLAILALPFVLILTPFLALIDWLSHTLQLPLQPILNQLALLAAQLQNWVGRVTRQPPPIVIALFRVLGYIVIIAIGLAVVYALVAVILKVGQRRKPKESDQDELHEFVWSGKALLRKLHARLFKRLAQLRNLAGIVGRFGAGGLFTALTIRRIYAQTVKLAASRGYPRPAAHTPYEHLGALHQAFPGCDADLVQITEAYVGVHYGELPEQPDALAEIREAFERIKTTQTTGQADKVTDRPVTDH
jgi:hypothetical protein